MRHASPQRDLHDLETNLYVALKAWDLAGRPATGGTASGLADALAALPDDWQPPDDWTPISEGEPDTAALLAEYVRQQP